MKFSDAQGKLIFPVKFCPGKTKPQPNITKHPPRKRNVLPSVGKHFKCTPCYINAPQSTYRDSPHNFRKYNLHFQIKTHQEIHYEYNPHGIYAPCNTYKHKPENVRGHNIHNSIKTPQQNPCSTNTP